MIRRALLLPIMLWAMAAFAGPAFAQPQPPRIVAVGDLHGDWPAWRAIARAAGIVDAKGHWAGGQTILIQTGDVPDRGPDTLKIINDLMRLQKEARRAGGKVVALVGNHEAMNVTGDLRYVDPGEYAAFVHRDSEQARARVFEANRSALIDAYRARDPRLSADAARDAWLKTTPLGMVEHRAAWHPTGRIGRWVAGNPAVALVDGNLFVHGGLSAVYAALPINEINRRVAASLNAADPTETAIINDPAGPLWYRGYAAAAAPAPSATLPAPTPGELNTVLKAYGAKRMVIAHTPALDGIVIADGGRLIRIDTGISRAYRGKPSYLEIRGDTVTPHLVERPNTGG